MGSYLSRKNQLSDKYLHDDASGLREEQHPVHTKTLTTVAPGGICFDLDLKIVSIPQNFSVSDWSGFLDRSFSTSTEEETKIKLKKYVLRFIKESDRWLHLMSILMKSKAYHEYHMKINSYDSDYKKRGLPIVDLPRTEYGKPFIEDNTSQTSKSLMPAPLISVSHHDHQVILARLIDPSSNPDKILMGADLTVIDSDHPEGVDKFLSYFESSFSSNEWTSIRYTQMFQGDLAAMQEFYCRWALKESYVKALGVGLSLNLQSFDMIVPTDNNLAFDLCQSSNEFSVHRIKVSFSSSKGTGLGRDEYWDCLLFLLGRQSVYKQSVVSVCVGPVAFDTSPSCFQVIETNQVKHEHVLNWHRGI